MTPHDALLQRYREIAALKSAASILQWDQQVLMPTGGAGARAEHSTRLASMIHQMLTSDETTNLLNAAEASAANEVETATVRVLKRDIGIASSFPPALIERKARVTANAFQAWRAARETSNFELYRPHLAEVVEIVKEVAECLGYENHPYDALIDQYEDQPSPKLTKSSPS